MSLDLEKVLATANGIIDEARTIIAARLSEGFEVKKKLDATLVTSVDLEVEKAVRARLQEEFPTHGIFGEEFAATNPESSLVWIIDPIDGTLRFRHRVPLYGTILALYDQSAANTPVTSTKRWAKSAGTPLVAILDVPEIDMRASGFQGGGAYMNGTRCKITDVASLEELGDELIATGGSGQYHGTKNEEFYHHLLRTHKNVVGYPDVFGHLLAVNGSLGAMLEMNLALWDVVATPLLIQEAGGKFACFDEFKDSQGGTRYSAIFGKPSVVDWLMEMRKKVVGA